MESRILVVREKSNAHIFVKLQVKRHLDTSNEKVQVIWGGQMELERSSILIGAQVILFLIQIHSIRRGESVRYLSIPRLAFWRLALNENNFLIFDLNQMQFVIIIE